MDSNNPQGFRFADLPQDLGRSIFQITAELDEESGRSCALVSKEINSWVEPILYRTIMIRNEILLSRFYTLIQMSKSNSSRRRPEFFALHVKSLSFTRNGSDLDLEETLIVLQACCNVEWLALWGFSREGERTALNNLHGFLTSPTMSPHHLSILTTLFPEDRINFSLPIFQSLTHLQLVWCQTVRPTRKDDVKWDTLGALKNLTHLSIYPAFQLEEGYSRFIEEIKSLWPKSLRVFIIWVYNTSFPTFDDARAITKGDVDTRTVLGRMAHVGDGDSRVAQYGFSRPFNSVLRDCAGIPVAKDMWTVAEDFIEARHRRGSP